MKQHLLAVLLLSSARLAVAADTPRDPQGVPKVDVHGNIVVVKPASTSNGFRVPAQRARMISVDGKDISLQEFLQTFCQGKLANETCVRANKIRGIDSSSGPKEQLPKGL